MTIPSPSPPKPPKKVGTLLYHSRHLDSNSPNLLPAPTQPPPLPAQRAIAPTSLDGAGDSRVATTDVVGSASMGAAAETNVHASVDAVNGKGEIVWE